MKKGLAVLLCLCIAFLPAIASAGAGTKIPGFDKSFLPPLPKPRLPGSTATQPQLNLKMPPKNQPPAAASLTITSLGAPSSAETVSVPALEALDTKLQEASVRLASLIQPYSQARPQPDPAPALRKTKTEAIRANSVAASSASASLASSSTSPPCSAQDCPQEMDSSSVPKGYLNENVSVTYDPNSTGGGTVYVDQTAKLAIQNWWSFNVAKNWTVDFEQSSSSWIILNRIWDQNPSTILGSITASLAKGSVYLINQNGILFGPRSQVDLHTLIASSLSLSTTDQDFLNGNTTLDFQAQDYQQYLLLPGGQPMYGPTTKYMTAFVKNQGTISTDTQGSVFLLAPNVTNDTTGTIQTTDGQIGLVAGLGVSLTPPGSGATSAALVVSITSPCTAIDTGLAINNGQMTDEAGLIGMYGQYVQQNGLISAVTDLTQNGQIELLATNSVSTGAGSTTTTPISGSSDSADSEFTITPGSIIIGGLGPAGTPTNTIVIDGALVSRSGSITLDAVQRVYLGSASSIDVSGLWIDEPASANLINVQMNSYQLRNEPIQKNGILKGQWITVDLLTGSSIGDISQAISAQTKTAQQFSLTGGTIDINSQSADIIAMAGSTLNFSGGGTTFASGNVTTTGLISGGKVYSISNAPDTLHYTGMTTVTNYVGGFVEGANAGQLTLNARYIVLDGQVNGSVTRGPYQTLAAELKDGFGDIKTDGLAEPSGGTLIIGNINGPTTSPSQDADFGLDAIVLQQSVPSLPSSFGPGDQPYTGPETTILSTNILNAAGLSNLSIYTNTGMTIDAGAQIALIPGGSFTAYARQIVDQGAISVPGGKISLTLMDNMTSFPGSSYVPLNSIIELDAGSSLDASGQIINGYTQSGWNDLVHIAGGTISVMDETQSGQGIVMQQGATINVNGGYAVSPTGTVTGGNAGKLTMQGSGIVLDGELSGISLIGNKGGSITLTAQNVWVTSSPQSLPPDYNAAAPNYLILDPSQLNGTGFTQIALYAADQLTLNSGTLSPSSTKLTLPDGGSASVVSSLISVSPGLITSSSITLNAGVPVSNLVTPTDAPLTVSPGAAVTVAPGGSINLGAPQVLISGELAAPAGNISVIASQENLTLSGAQISAKAYNEPNLTSVLSGVPDGYTPMGGGSVTLQATSASGSAASGNVIIDSASTVDVSGSTPVTTYVLNSGLPVPVTVAGAPGSITISFTGNNSSLSGSLKGQAYLSGLQGGTLSISDLNTSSSYTLMSADMGKYLSAGFDDLSFKSAAALVFSGFSAATTFKIGRGLTLDAPVLTFSGQDPSPDVVNLFAPWVVLQNTSTTAPRGTASGVSGQLNISGDWINITGIIQCNGFGKISLAAVQDISFSDYIYSSIPQGQLQAPGDLTLTAEHIYPVTDANFTISSGGTVTILPGGTPANDSVYSAGGILKVDAQNIDIEGGYLAAPMGQIYLNASSNVLISSGSVITTAAGTDPIYYGVFDGITWTAFDSATGTTSQVQGPPSSSIQITGAEVTAMSGSKIDVSGGSGGIFVYQFQPSLQGSADPITGSYVIVPGYTLPASAAAQAGLQVGQAVYLEGGNGLAAGVYAVLPEQYAFLPGAMIVTPLGGTISKGQHLVTSAGYSIEAGYSTFMGTGVSQPLYSEYEIRTASEVFTQGYFDTVSYTAGNAGSITIAANTTVVAGQILGNALSGYLGGSISLSGSSAEIGASTTQKTTDSLFVSAAALSGFNDVDITASAGSIQVDSGAALQGTEVNLTALKGGIILAAGTPQAQTRIVAGSAVLTAGYLDMEQNSLVNASDQVTMQIGAMGSMVSPGNFQNGFWGSVQIGSGGTLELISQNICFVPQNGSLPQSLNPSVLYLPYAFWQQFGSSNSTKPTTTFDNVKLFATGAATDGSLQGSVEFPDVTSLYANQSFTINAAEIEGSLNTADSAVTIAAPTIYLVNRGGWDPNNPLAPTRNNTGSLTLNATNQIIIGEGAFLNGLTPPNPISNGLLIDGFSTINLNAANDVIFRGSGAPVISATNPTLTIPPTFSLVTGANLNFNSARVTTSCYYDPTNDPNTPYTAANVTVNATTGNVTIASNGTTPATTAIPGGTLEIDANSIDVTGVIRMASGTLTLSGANGVTVDNPPPQPQPGQPPPPIPPPAQIIDAGEEILVPGTTTYVCTPGGSVYLNSSNGSVKIGSNASVNVSGVTTDLSTDPNDLGVNAGLISIYSSGTATLLGTLTGLAGTRAVNGSSGVGGSFILDADSIVNTQDGTFNFSALLLTLTQAPVSPGLIPTGFTQNIDITVGGQSSPVNLVIKNTDAIYANNVNLTTNNGYIDFSGTIDSTALGGGGTIQFNSGGNLTLEASSKIISPGATVFLNTADGNQPGNLYSYGSIDVTGLPGQQNGTVHFRAPWISYYDGYDGGNANTIRGAITGANQVLAEGVLYGGNNGVSTQQVNYTANGGNITSANIGYWLNGSSTAYGIQYYFPQGAATPAGLSPTLYNCGGTAQFVPGLEVRSSGNLTLANTWDLTNGSSGSYGSWDHIGPGFGFVTLMAAGNLNINANLTDSPSTPGTLSPSIGVLLQSPGTASWGLNLIAGADLGSANPMATVKDLAGAGGNLIIGNGVMVYTQSAPINFASGNDTEIGAGAPFGYMINSAIRYNLGSFSGEVQGEVGGDLVITAGAIQTATGNIDITIGGNLDLNSGPIFEGNGQITALGAIRTTGETTKTGSQVLYWDSSNGGNIDLTVTGAVEGAVQSTAWDYIYPATRLIAKNWGALYVGGSEPGITATAGLATMGGGNLTVYAGGDFYCQSGTFGAGPGNLTIYSGGSLDGLFLIRNGAAELTAMGNFGSTSTVIEAFNAQIAVNAQGNVELGTVANPLVAESYGSLGYTVNSSVRITAVTGDVTLSGADPFAQQAAADYATILPADFEVYAGGNISIESNFALAPAADGNLVLSAGGNINGSTNGTQTSYSTSSIYVSDLEPSQVYGVAGLVPTILTTPSLSEQSLLHAGDPNPIEINAGNNIENIQLYVPKMAQVTAGENISNIFFLGQNLSATDVTTIKAGGNIIFGSFSGAIPFNSGIKIAGPGLLVVEAGGSIDLGTSGGIQSIGDIFNPALQIASPGSCSLLVVSGYSKDFTLDATSTFFGELGTAGDLYTHENDAGDAGAAQETIQDAETEVIDPFLGGSTVNNKCYINMTNSQISTAAGGAIYVLSSGTLNVGASSFFSTGAQSTGVFTSAGGNINIYAESDINVNQSRVMTFDGGSITAWSNHGNINAGKGSPTAVNLLPPVVITVGGINVEEFVPPSIGSGIRATSYNPDVTLGDVSLFAPQGVIDASEAGIAGNLVILGALQVLNAQNIVSVSGSVGVPSAASSVSGLTALSGVGNVTQTMQTQEASMSAAAGNKLAQAIAATAEGFITTSLEVKVLSVFDSDPNEGSWEKTDN